MVSQTPELTDVSSSGPARRLGEYICARLRSRTKTTKSGKRSFLRVSKHGDYYAECTFPAIRITGWPTSRCWKRKGWVKILSWVWCSTKRLSSDPPRWVRCPTWGVSPVVAFQFGGGFRAIWLDRLGVSLSSLFVPNKSKKAHKNSVKAIRYPTLRCLDVNLDGTWSSLLLDIHNIIYVVTHCDEAWRSVSEDWDDVGV